MSKEEDFSDSGDDLQDSTPESNTPNASTHASARKGSAKSSKPRLTAVQKNTNHKDAENKRRNAIRERFTELSRLVPEAEGQERSEQVMLTKTTEYLRNLLEEQRQLEREATRQGVFIEPDERLREDDFGGQLWKPTNMEAYHATKAKRGPSKSHSGQGDDEGD